MEKNPLQHTHQYLWAKINKTKIIPQYPNHTMVIDNGEGDRDIHHTWEKITEMTSNGFCNGQSSNLLFRFRFRCKEISWVSCFGLDH